MLQRVFKKHVPHLNMQTHDFRTSRVNHLLDQGLDAKEIQEFVGHSSVSTTMLYIKKNKEDVLNKINALDASTGVKRKAKALRKWLDARHI